MSEFGTIIVRVFTSQAKIPIENATVTITQNIQGGALQLLSVQITDQNGHTAPVAIPTPDLAESLRPEPSRPYALCNVCAEHPSYEMLIVDDVQIFPERETIQDMQLIPLPEADFAGQVDVVDIPPQDL